MSDLTQKLYRVNHRNHELRDQEMLTDRPDILISTELFPPYLSGTTIVLHELLRNMPKERFVVVFGASISPRLPNLELGISLHQVELPGGPVWTNRLARFFPGLYMWKVRQTLRRVARHNQVRRMYVHFPNSLFAVAGWQVARELKIPLTLYMDILWQESGGPGSVQGKLGDRYEHELVTYADHRFAITEFAVDHLTRKHGVPFELMPHTMSLKNLPTELVEVKRERPLIQFTGAVYPRMNLDSVVRLIDAVERASCRPELDLCTPRPVKAIEERGYRTHIMSRDELAKLLRQCTILYAPLAFESDSPEAIRYNFSTKVMDYCLSGRPILVHAPADTYLAHLARDKGIGFLVDQPDPDALAAGIDRLNSDRELQARCVTAALAWVSEHDTAAWWPKLWDALRC